MVKLAIFVSLVKEIELVLQNLKIVDIVEETKDTKTYMLEKPEAFTWNEGDHTHIAHVGFNSGQAPNKTWVRHMSISTLPNENKIGITTRVRTECSEYKDILGRLGVGEELVLFKLGSRMQIKRLNRPLVLLSTGVGIATFRPVILAYANDPSNVSQLINVNVDSSGDFVFRDELDQLESESYKNYWVSSRAMFNELFESLTGVESPIYYVVGSDLFVKEMIQRLRSKHVSDQDIVIDKGEKVYHEFFGS